MASSTEDSPPSSANAPAVDGGDVQQQEVMPSGSNSGSPGNAMPMNPLLLASACLGSSAALKFLFDREDNQEPPMLMPTQVFLEKLLAGHSHGSRKGRTVKVPQSLDDLEAGADQPATLPATAPGTAEGSTAAMRAAPGTADAGADQPAAMQAVASDDHDTEDGIDVVDDATVLPAAARLLKGVTAVGDTALHVIATHGDSTEFLECASIINTRDQDLLFVVNTNGDTPLHCAARAGKSPMLSRLIVLAGTGYWMLQLLRKETALHEAIRNGNDGIVEHLLEADPGLGLYPEQGTSPLYLAILEGKYAIAEKLHSMSNGNLSYDGPHGKTALHAATFQREGITKLILNWNKSLTTRGDSDGSTPLHLASSFNHSSAFKILFEAIIPIIFQESFKILFEAIIPIIFQESFKNSVSFVQLFEANPATVYQADNKGLFPIHVAASVGAEDTIRIILDKYPSSAGLRTAQGRTFLHVAVEKKRLDIVSFVCRTASLAWILNMQDNDGNTAMHLAVQTGSLHIFCSLYGNKGVLLSLANNSEETPIDLSRILLPRGITHNWSSEVRIYFALTFFGTNHSGIRWDQHQEKYNRKLKPEDMAKEEEKVKDSSQILGISSVLIASVAFSATFAVPGGFIADDHTNRGTPTLSGTYTFDAFMMATALAFICSLIATIGLTLSGSSLYAMRTRRINLTNSVFYLSSSVTSLSAAFALGVYMVLATVARPTAIALCVLSPLVVLYGNIEVMKKMFVLARPFYLRLGPIRASKWFLDVIISRISTELWPFIVIFGWASIAQKLRNH